MDQSDCSKRGCYYPLLLFLLMYADSAYSQMHYYITPSLNVPCPQDPCLTLPQFSASYLGNETNISLSFLPGNHSLDGELSLSRADNFTVAKDIGSNGTVFVECAAGQSGRLNISETTFTTIQGLHFIGCGGNRVSQVKQFIIEDTIFRGVEGRGTALLLNEVTAVSITKCLFISNLHDSNFEQHKINLVSSSQDKLNYLYLERNSSFAVGGALYAAFSNVSINSSQFTHNTAEIGGALFVENSRVYVAGSEFNENTASFGGAMITFKSSVVIDNSTFNKNAAKVSGGVMITYKDSFAISNATFTNSSAGVNSGVMETYETLINIIDSSFSDNTGMESSGVMTAVNSSFCIISTTYTNNRATGGSGVMAIFKSSFNINCSTFTNNSAFSGGVMIISDESSFDIISSTFTNNSATFSGGVMRTLGRSVLNITSSTFTNNSAKFGGVMRTQVSSIKITSSTFTSNSARSGGVMRTSGESSFNITCGTFSNNIATVGGVLYTRDQSSFKTINTTFTNNSATQRGGVITTYGKSSFSITSSTFTKNSAINDGVILAYSESSFDIISSVFIQNRAIFNGGVIEAYDESSFTIINSTFSYNRATFGGVIQSRKSEESSFNMYSSTFTSNQAVNGGVVKTFSIFNFSVTNSMFANNSAIVGGAMAMSGGSLFSITNSTFTNNSAIDYGGVIQCSRGSFNIDNTWFNSNVANNYGGTMFIIECSTHIANSMFDHNLGSLYTFNSNLTFSGYTRFENCAEPSNKTASEDLQIVQEGGAITSFQSNVIFTGAISLSNNQARHGGAILVTGSKVMLYGDTTIANNTATDSNGGGIFLYQSELEIKGNCNISDNHARKGGGIHTTSSTIAIYKPATLQFINNTAINGSGLYLQVYPKLYILKTPIGSSRKYDAIIFSGNHANYGGAVYVEDNTNSGACSPDSECFIQTLALHQQRSTPYSGLSTENIDFSNNTASEQGTNLFGGLLDRCIPSPFAEVYLHRRTHYSGVTYLGNISNIVLDSISSSPVRVCFCNRESEPDCSYQPPPIKVKKGKAFNVSLVAVDQVNHSVDANITSSLSSQDGGFSEGQQTQSLGRNCTNITFNVFSPHDSETITLFADGPCGSSTPSIRYLDIQFTDCTCPVGFQPSNDNIRCECFCDSILSPYIASCNLTSKSLLRATNSWITYINDTDPPGYIIHPNCPFDCCQPLTENVNINLNLPNGADAQCAHHRRGILCGECQEPLSLSLGSSHCLPCRSHWPAVFVVILLVAIIAGILLVAALLALNMTVAVGLINGFIFYANIVEANSAVFFPSSDPSFPTVFVAWLNLDIGVDVCFFDGLDAYTKTWLQLAFPVYIIFLVIIVIIVSEYSPRFAALIGKRDPIATLATLILLSYAKLLSVTITALSYAVLYYPDGSQETVWLPDGNVKYFHGKHIFLAFMALLIILIGAPYTILLFLWQWLVRAPKWKVFKWTRNTKLNAFISVHHVPYNSKYRYWTGLLLLVRVVLYLTASVTVSQSDKPQTALLVTSILLAGLFLLKGIIGMRIYKKLIVDVLQTGLYFNLLTFAIFSSYDFKADINKQTAVAYTSTIIIFLLLVGVIIYHVSLLVRKDKLPEEVNEYPLAPIQPAEVTHSVIEIPKPRDQSPPPETNSDEAERIQEREDDRYITPPYQ